MTAPSPRRRHRTALPLATLTLLASLAGDLAGAAQHAPEIAFERCAIGERGASLRAECARVAVPLDPDAPDGAALELAVARLRVPGGARHPDPFTLIAGGPGQSAIDTWPRLAFAFRHIARERDVILVDQRGTGASRPLECPEDEVSDEATFDVEPAEIRRRTRACLAALDADPRLFTTSVAVRDLERVRERLGIARWNLYGVSYGTRVAQHYARLHPERVRTMILDAVVPPTMPIGPDASRTAERALGLLFDRCRAQTGCDARFPEIESRTRAWLERLAERPLDVEHEDLASGERRTTRFGKRELAALLRLLSYNAETAALLPSLLHDAIEGGNVAPLVRQLAMQGRSLGASLASGMYRAVVCTEDTPRAGADGAGPRSAALGTAAGYLGHAPLEALLASCAGWPRGRLDERLFEPLASSIPTLILSGEADPITPPAYGERVAATLERARHVVVGGSAHVQAPVGCLPTLMARFVTTADPAALALDCLERHTPPAFFVDANGPLP